MPETSDHIVRWGATRLPNGDIQLQINGRPIGTLSNRGALDLGDMLRSMVLGTAEAQGGPTDG